MIILVREEQEPGPDLVRVQAMPMQVVEQVQEEAAEPEVVVVPAGILVPLMITSSPKLMVVAELAPVRQTCPKGTRSPNTFLPFMLGRE